MIKMERKWPLGLKNNDTSKIYLMKGELDWEVTVKYINKLIKMKAIYYDVVEL